MGVVRAGDRGRFATLDVAVGRTGPGRAYADGDESIGFFRDLQCIPHHGLVGGGVFYELVGGQHHHHRIRVARGNETDTQRDGGGGVALGRLRENVFRWQHGGDFTNGIDLKGVRQDQDVFERHETFQSADGLLQQGAVAEKIEQLLGLIVAAQRPKAGSRSAGEDQCVGIFRSWHPPGTIAVRSVSGSRKCASESSTARCVTRALSRRDTTPCCQGSFHLLWRAVRSYR